MNIHDSYPKIAEYRAESQAAYDLMGRLFPDVEPQERETKDIGIQICREQTDHGFDIVASIWRPRDAERGFHLRDLADTPANDVWVDAFTLRFESDRVTIAYELEDLESGELVSHEEQLVPGRLRSLPGELKDFFTASSVDTA